MFLTGIMPSFYPSPVSHKGRFFENRRFARRKAAVFEAEFSPKSVKSKIPTPESSPVSPKGEKPKHPQIKHFPWKAVTIINRPAPFPHRPLVGFGKGGGKGHTRAKPVADARSAPRARLDLDVFRVQSKKLKIAIKSNDEKLD